MDKQDKELLKISNELNAIKDLDQLLESLLTMVRDYTGADAGSVLTKNEENQICLQYVQNDTLVKKGIFKSGNILSHDCIDINTSSIAGYVGHSKKPLLIKNAYDISDEELYSFDPSFDKKTSYKTESILALPLISSRNEVKGVIELINKKDKNNSTISFNRDDLLYVKHFGNIAAGAIERASMTREIILRMIKMAELRDPKETGPHVNRVGAYSVAIYKEWASRNDIPEEKVKKFKDNLRIAAMLHDLGKVGISDKILKKPARLTKEERHTMMYHTVIGAKLFKNKTSELDKMAASICINHHEKYNGEGYPGKIGDIFKEDLEIADNGKKGEEIPLSGRIVAVADVYDALISKRTYKDGWPAKEVNEYIKSESGKHFDPELVSCFFEVQDSIKTIREKFSE